MSATNPAPARPLWKRAGSLVRNTAYRLATPVDRLVRWQDRHRLPPAHLRHYYYRTFDPAAFIRHCEGTRHELISRGLRPEHRVLDIGSGVGNLAIGLEEYLRGTYDGIEIHPEAVAWCQRAISSRLPRFRFHRADLISRAYNPRGAVSAAQYRFPFQDNSFDFVFLASVFTHMLPDAVENYVREIARVLAPGGVSVETFFLLNDETRPSVDADRGFMTFRIVHPSGVCRLHDAAVPEAAVAFEETFVRRAHEAARLTIRDVRRGQWWNGSRHDQDVLTVVGDILEGAPREPRRDVHP